MNCTICTVKLHCRVQYNGNGIRVVVSGCHLGLIKIRKKIKGTGRKGWII